MQIIHNWLKGSHNFSVGVTLYNKFGGNEAFKKVLLQGETTTAKQQLVEELENLCSTVTSVPPPVPKPESPEQDKPALEDPILQAIDNEWKPWYHRMNLLRHSLDQYGNQNTEEAIAFRKPIAAEIKELERKCMATWAKKDYYKKEGKLPFIQEQQFTLPEDPLELARLLNSIKKNIRFNRKQMQDKPGEPKYAQLYMTYKEQFKTITGKDYVEKN